MNTGIELQRTLYLKAYDLLISTNRNTDGRGYEQLKGALDRLSGTRIRTNIKTGDQEETEGFGLIVAGKLFGKPHAAFIGSARADIRGILILEDREEDFRLSTPASLAKSGGSKGQG